MDIEVPQGSIYFWMYSMGLKHVDLDELILQVHAAGKDVREKDYDNYWRGWYKADLYITGQWDRIFKFHHWLDVQPSKTFTDTPYHKYPDHPYAEDIEERWVPCNKNNKPMIKWGEGCMSYTDAMCYPHSCYLAENMKGCNRIVIDCDGDHDAKLDMETIAFLWRFASMTHTLVKPKNINEYEGYENTGLQIPASFHLTFEVTKVIPTMHFPEAHIDIVGNRRNSLRYFKNKLHNGKPPARMTEEIWSQLQQYIKHRTKL